jgi:hypothetical protein
MSAARKSLRSIALRARCPVCHQAEGYACIDRASGRKRYGTGISGAHPERLKRATDIEIQATVDVGDYYAGEGQLAYERSKELECVARMGGLDAALRTYMEWIGR